MVQIATAVEHDLLDAFLLGPFGDQLAYFLGRTYVSASRPLVALYPLPFSTEVAETRVMPCASSITWA